MRLPRLAPDRVSHEDLFLGYYARLRARALALSGHDAALADDLLHDAFIQFTLVRPPLEAIASAEGYLVGMLRHLHASHVRRAARRGIAPVPLDEFEFLAGDMRTLAAAEARQELALLCRYACLRKESSKAGSVLILRFLLGYFPSEIARIAHLSAHAVDEWLRLARREARWFRDDPGKLAFLQQRRRDRAEAAPLPPPLAAGDPESLLRALRQAVVASRTGPCLSSAVLRREYQPPRATPLATPLLAHLASCPPCLARVCALLSIPNASDRFPGDPSGPDAGPRASDRAREGAADVARRERKRRNVFEHRPEELCIAVNGRELARCTVGQALTRQALTINVNEPLAFVEVFSVEGVRLLFASIEPFPAGAVEQTARASLSEDRSLDLRVRFVEPWPDMEIVYRDPHRPAAASDEGDLATRPIASDPAPPSRLSWLGLPGLGWLAQRPARAMLGAVVLALTLLFALVGPSTMWAAIRQAGVQLLRMLHVVPPMPLPARPLVVVTPLPSAPPRVSIVSSIARRGREQGPLIAREVDVLQRLDAIDALLGREALVSRRASHIVVQAFGAMPARRTAIVQALRDLDACQCVIVLLDPPPVRSATVREPMARAVPSSEATFPLQADVERVFALTRRADPVAASQAAQAFAARVLGEARALLLHAGALRDLRGRFDASQRAAMPADARVAWRSMLHGHVRDVEQAGATLSASLAPWLSDGPSDTAATSSPSPLAAVDAATVDAGAASADVAIEQLFGLAVTIDEVVREAFAAGPDAPGALRLSTPRFRAALDAGQAVARRIQLDDTTIAK